MTPLRSRTGAALITATVLASMAVPAIGRDLGAGVAGLQWALTGYLLTVAALLLLSGALADHFGRRRILVIGLLAMLVSSVLCAVAPTIGVLIAARVLQGAGAALVVPTSLALLNGTLRVGDRARGIGLWAGIAGVAALVALVPVERRVRAPMVRLSLFGSRQFDAINMTTVLFYGALAAGGYLLVLQCQLVLGYSAAREGAVAVPNSLLFLILSPVAGALVPRVGPRRLMAAGIVLVGAGFLALSRVRAGDAYASAILPGVLLQGLGLGLAVTPLTSAVLAAVPDADLGEASAVNDAAARVGAVLAVAAVPLLIGAGGDDLGQALVAGFGPAMLVLAVLCALSAVVTAVFVSDRKSTVEAPRLAPLPGCHACAVPATS